MSYKQRFALAVATGFLLIDAALLLLGIANARGVLGWTLFAAGCLTILLAPALADL